VYETKLSRKLSERG